MSRFYMSADGGGSKLAVILFDEHMNLHGTGKSGPINPKFVSKQIICDNIMRSIEQCLHNQKIDKIENLYISMPGPSDLFADLLSKKVSVENFTIMSEGEMALLAGMFDDRGIVALSGTGSGVFNINGSGSTHIGGWGALFDDEGSGYYIGAAAINAAIKSFDKRGKHTLLEEAIDKHFKLNGLRNIIEHVYDSPNYRGVIASLTVSVLEIANNGDKIAQSIMRRAGCQMARQVITLINRDYLSPDQPVMIAGSVWKDNIYMYDAFCKILLHTFPHIKVTIPVFEPVMGGVIKVNKVLTGEIDDMLLDCLKVKFDRYIYNFNKNKIIIRR